MPCSSSIAVTQEASFYHDLPCVGTDQGHHGDYLQEDSDAFLAKMEGFQGRFLPSLLRNNPASGICDKEQLTRCRGEDGQLSD
jgi:hypothetical protein